MKTPIKPYLRIPEIADRWARETITETGEQRTQEIAEAASENRAALYSAMWRGEFGDGLLCIEPNPDLRPVTPSKATTQARRLNRRREARGLPAQAIPVDLRPLYRRITRAELLYRIESGLPLKLRKEFRRMPEAHFENDTTTSAKWIDADPTDYERLARQKAPTWDKLLDTAKDHFSPGLWLANLGVTREAFIAWCGRHESAVPEFWRPAASSAKSAPASGKAASAIPQARSPSKKRKKRPHDAAADAELAKRIYEVMRAAGRTLKRRVEEGQWPRKFVRQVVKLMFDGKTEGQIEGFSDSTVRQILMGTYAPMRRMGIRPDWRPPPKPRARSGLRQPA